MKAYRFVHLNVHSHYSIKDGCASIREFPYSKTKCENSVEKDLR